MKCPYCDADNKSRVIDTTRDLQDGIRRRRECKVCGRRFNTYEKVMRATPLLIKSTGDREAFDREKLIRGVQIACAKRPIPASAISDLVEHIETHLQNMGRDEVSSRVVGDMIIDGLKRIDPIAYIRYAIVYLGLDSMTSVRDMIDSMLGGEQNESAHAAASPNAPASGEEVVHDEGAADEASSPTIP